MSAALSRRDFLRVSVSAAGGLAVSLAWPRLGTAEEVANGVVFISSPMASRISGSNLVIDGALTVAV